MGKDFIRATIRSSLRGLKQGTKNEKNVEGCSGIIHPRDPLHINFRPFRLAGPLAGRGALRCSSNPRREARDRWSASTIDPAPDQLMRPASGAAKREGRKKGGDCGRMLGVINPHDPFQINSPIVSVYQKRRLKISSRSVVQIFPHRVACAWKTRKQGNNFQSSQ